MLPPRAAHTPRIFEPAWSGSREKREEPMRDGSIVTPFLAMSIHRHRRRCPASRWFAATAIAVSRGRYLPDAWRRRVHGWTEPARCLRLSSIARAMMRAGGSTSHGTITRCTKDAPAHVPPTEWARTRTGVDRPPTHSGPIVTRVGDIRPMSGDSISFRDAKAAGHV